MMTTTSQCLSWMRTLEALPSRPSTTTCKSPWVFAPTLLIERIESFQRQHQVVLPTSYTEFLTQLGNGTAKGGWFQIFPLGMTVSLDNPDKLEVFEPSQPGALARLFEHGAACSEEFDDELIAEYLEEDGTLPTRFDDSVMPGALPLADEGCSEWCYLALNGEHAGTVWELSNGWLSPVPTPWLRPVTMMEWVVGEVARQRGLIDEFREMTGVRPFR
jgi:hypothetical protein